MPTQNRTHFQLNSQTCHEVPAASKICWLRKTCIASWILVGDHSVKTVFQLPSICTASKWPILVARLWHEPLTLLWFKQYLAKLIYIKPFTEISQLDSVLLLIQVVVSYWQ